MGQCRGWVYGSAGGGGCYGVSHHDFEEGLVVDVSAISATHTTFRCETIAYIVCL